MYHPDRNHRQGNSTLHTKRTGEELEIVGIRDTKKTVCTGVEMFRKLLDTGEAGDNIGALLRGVEREDVERGQDRKSVV